MTLQTVSSLTGDESGSRTPLGATRRPSDRVCDRFSDHLSDRAGWIRVFALCFVIWLTMRMVFFVGLTGSDDMYYLRYAALWDRAPVNDWEARLLGNALTAVSMRVFGVNAVAAAIPSLVASLSILACVLLWCRRFGTITSALWSGLIIAVLPLDVEMGTSISPHTIMAAFMAAGTLCLMRSEESARWKWAGCILTAVGVITHLAGLYYLAALLVAGVLVQRRRFVPLIPACALTVAGAVLIDMLVFGALFGDPFARVRVCMAEMHTLKPHMPTDAAGSFDWEFLGWPIRNLLYSKALGVTLLVALGVGAIRFRQLNAALRVMLITGILYWLWMSFGSQVPWSYKPFWRMSRFLHPYVFALAVLLGSLMANTRRRAYRVIVGGGVLGVCLVNLLAGGSWGRNVALSRELLAYAQTHADRHFVTDYHTLNEMYVINGLRTPPNVTTTTDVPPSRLLDPSAHPTERDAVPAPNAILVNPINTARTPRFAHYLSRHEGVTEFTTPETLRRICRLIPPLASASWAVRKPPAQVVTFRPSDALLTDAKRNNGVPEHIAVEEERPSAVMGDGRP